MNDEIKLKDMTDFLENVYKDIKKQPTLEEELEKERKFINKIKGNNEDEIKEILDDLDNAINELPKVNNIVSSLNELKVEDLREAVKRFKHIPSYDELLKENKDYKSRIEKATNELFELKDMIYKPETRDENIPIQQKISSIIKQLNGKE